MPKFLARIKNLIVILFILLSSSLAFCIDVAITVVDGDLGIALEGARIIFQGREFICDGAGKAFISVPDTRPVLIEISYPGYKTRVVSLQIGITEYTATLLLEGIMEERELVIEANRSESGETAIGRSVAVSGRDLARSAETGFVEDVMRAVKLLPGVGYIGGYLAMPSVRGGAPEDISAVFDGFYIEQPFHWGGAFSIFDPKMIESAQLSHGVFSARYGHTISGLLDIHAKNPSRDTAEMDLAVSTSAANVNFSLPLGKKSQGGFFLMGRVTYWDPFVEAAKLFIEEVKYVRKAPYIRSTSLNTSYNFSADLSASINGFFGGDGIGVYYDDYSTSGIFEGDFLYDNKVGFLTSLLSYNPRENILLKFRLGGGFYQNDLDGNIYSENLTTGSIEEYIMFNTERTIYAQGRFDLDWEWKEGLIFSAGVEERYSRWDKIQKQSITRSTQLPRPSWNLSVLNHGFASALYTILEYTSKNRIFSSEFGLRLDHFFLKGDEFLLKGIPVFNPRLNLDFILIQDKGIFDTVSLTAGTGLFSSVNTALQSISSRNTINEFEATQNRSWTSVIGTKIDFLSIYTFTLEGYIKDVFNRAYNVVNTDDIANLRVNNYYFDGKAFIWGFDTMLQKRSSRYWDGWISYTYINAKYIDPKSGDRSKNRGDWYYPIFHRFHTLNIIMNYKPVLHLQLTGRFSFASGIPIPKTVRIEPDTANPGRYRRIQQYDDTNRAGFIMPLDIKLSFFRYNRTGKIHQEIYFSFENLLSLVYTPEGPKDFDSHTGKETEGFSFASYDLPVPLLTFGIKWSY